MGCPMGKPMDQTPLNVDVKSDKKPVSERPTETADETATVPSVKWWEVPLPSDYVVVRKEVRKMSKDEQERYAAAVLKMRENTNGPGTSLYFQVACIHGGVPEAKKGLKVAEGPWNKEFEMREFCAHGRECFPNWHRPYMLAFEHGLRRADIALGGDGNIGLPYWDWSEVEVNGEVLPGIVREKLMVEFPDDFWPEGTDLERVKWSYRMSATNDDSRIKRYFERADLGKMADDCLKSVRHEHHACTRFGSKPSLEQPHNNVHGYVGGIMASYQSSFHPVFWLHHNNVDRIYEKYIELEPDSAAEFEAHQEGLAKKNGSRGGEAGFPEGSWGPYMPFKHPKTGAVVHSRDTFNIRELGFTYDALPEPSPPRMREHPYCAVLSGVDVRKLISSRLVYLYTLSPEQASTWTMPDEPDEDKCLAHTGFAKTAAIFFIDSPDKCENCMSKEPYDVAVNVTPALREYNLDPATVVLKAIALNVATRDFEMVEFIQSGTFSIPGLPPPVLKGPKDASATHAADSGLSADDLEPGAGLASTAKRGDTLSWSLDETCLPRSLPASGVIAELEAAFAQWGEVTGLVFSRVASGGSITVEFDDMTPSNENVFDGPGGKLAQAVVSPAPTITFDSAERWELSSSPHPHKAKFSWDDVYFKLLPVALHEIGHLLSLTHSETPADVMSPFYDETQTALSDNDKERALALFPL